MSNTFTCSGCNQTFDKGWSDEEAAEEALDLWGVENPSDASMAIICDDCFERLMGNEEATAPVNEERTETKTV